MTTNRARGSTAIIVVAIVSSQINDHWSLRRRRRWRGIITWSTVHKRLINNYKIILFPIKILFFLIILIVSKYI
jgi:hypothetical protein